MLVICLGPLGPDIHAAWTGFPAGFTQHCPRDRHGFPAISLLHIDFPLCTTIPRSSKQRAEGLQSLLRRLEERLGWAFVDQCMGVLYRRECVM